MLYTHLKSQRSANRTILLLSWWLSFAFVVFDVLAPSLLILFSTHVHELGHASATWLTAGVVYTFEVSPDGSGAVTFGNTLPFFPLISGYFAPLILGILLMYAATFSEQLFMWCVWLAVWLALPLIVANDSFTTNNTYVAIFLFCVLGVVHQHIQRCCFAFMGAFNIICTLDSMHSITVHSYQHSDAFYLTNRYGGFPEEWSKMWLIVGVVAVIYGYLIIYLRARNERP